MSISSYYAKLRLIWESLIELKPAHTCTCNDIKSWSDYDKMEYAMHFLMGLNEAYSSIKGQILSMDSFTSITKVFPLIAQEEKQRELVLQLMLSLLMPLQSRMVLVQKTRMFRKVAQFVLIVAFRVIRKLDAAN